MPQDHMTPEELKKAKREEWRKARAEKKEADRIAREEKREAKAIEAKRTQKPVKSITITIEWKKSRMWGMNPHCTAQVQHVDGTYSYSPNYTASGCGYDKESTVIADVFNEFLAYHLYTIPIEKSAKDCPYGISLSRENKYYNGGIGTNCYYKIAEYIGGKFESIASGKTFNVWKFTAQEGSGK